MYPFYARCSHFIIWFSECLQFWTCASLFVSVTFWSRKTSAAVVTRLSQFLVYFYTLGFPYRFSILFALYQSYSNQTKKDKHDIPQEASFVSAAALKTAAALFQWLKRGGAELCDPLLFIDRKLWSWKSDKVLDKPGWRNRLKKIAELDDCRQMLPTCHCHLTKFGQQYGRQQGAAHSQAVQYIQLFRPRECRVLHPWPTVVLAVWAYNV